MSDIKVNRINRNFKIKVHLYFNKDSFNYDTDGTPRFYLQPVELLNIEKVAFTRTGAEKRGYKRYGNRFWKWIADDTLTDAEAEAIYEDIKGSYPYGYYEGDLAGTNKYNFDVKNNHPEMLIFQLTFTNLFFAIIDFQVFLKYLSLS